eukprot:snap_masked-scaffold918_size81203-processed-gene-0.2 protein:Tk10450 transcript:snap_masked-scaffold918_size81203-processed-gene-0.2-mRNA-1 annotation:"beta- -galactosyltransferase"
MQALSFRSRVYLILALCLLLSLMSLFWLHSLPLRSADTPYLQDVQFGHKLCVLVPFRDRFDELTDFVPHLSDFLNRQGIRFEMFILNQVDEYRFNRAALLNAGFLHGLAHSTCDYVALHDVDLMPLNPELSYRYPLTPMHLAAPGLHPKYDYATFVGGILLMTSRDFQAVDGMTNNFWGWGLEDDELYARLKEAQLPIQRPQGLLTGPKDTFKHYHSRRRRPRDYKQCYNQRDFTQRRDRSSGLSNLAHRVVRETPMTLSGYGFQVLNIWLTCDKAHTPFCDCQGAPATEAPLQPVKPEDKIVPRLKKTHTPTRQST